MPEWTEDEWVDGVMLVAEYEAAGESNAVREAALFKANARWHRDAKKERSV